MLREQLTDALKVSMKSQDKRRTATLRLILAAIKDRDIAAHGSDSAEPVSDDEILSLLAKMVKQRRETIEVCEQAGRTKLAEQENAEIEIIESFLPQQLSESETADACREVIAEIEAGGIKDMGRTMGVLKERYAGRVDFAQASKLVKELLS